MTIGISAPTPSGIPGFNVAGFYCKAGSAVGVINARALPSWYNIVRDAPVANAPVTLPPAVCGGQEIVVWNYTNGIDPTLGTPLGITNTVQVFGNVNPYGTQDTIDSGGTQVTTGVTIPPGAMVLFYVMTPQAGFTNYWLGGMWNYKILP